MLLRWYSWLHVAILIDFASCFNAEHGAEEQSTRKSPTRDATTTHGETTATSRPDREGALPVLEDVPGEQDDSMGIVSDTALQEASDAAEEAASELAAREREESQHNETEHQGAAHSRAQVASDDQTDQEAQSDTAVSAEDSRGKNTSSTQANESVQKIPEKTNGTSLAKEPAKNETGAPRQPGNTTEGTQSLANPTNETLAIQTKGEHQSLMRPVHMKPPTPTQMAPSASNVTSATINAASAGNASSVSNSSNGTGLGSGPGAGTSRSQHGAAGNKPSKGAAGSMHQHESSTTMRAHKTGGGEHQSQQVRPVNMRRHANHTPASTTRNTTALSATHAPTNVSAAATTTAVAPSTSSVETTSTQDVASDSILRNFPRFAREADWPRSPYVSQARLDTLWNYLFSTYYKEVPPVPEYGGPLPVGVGINVVKFKDFDEVAGTMNVALNLRLCWADARLSFDAKEFFNVTWSHEGDKIPIKSNLIWTPDVTVLNEVGGLDRLLSTRTSPVVLSDDSFRSETGVNVLWSHPLDVKSNCEVDMSRYPFDQQQCYIVVGSWASSDRQMVLVPQPFFQEETVHTSEFFVKNITVGERTVYTKDTAQQFHEVVYSLVLRRYPHYYVVNYIFPMVALTLLTVATMWMSPGNVGPRVNSGTKLLLCVVSIMFITARSRPAVNGDIWMDRFQSHCLALSMSAVLESLFIDWLSKIKATLEWMPPHETVDSLLRAAIAGTTTLVIFGDAREAQTYSREETDDGRPSTDSSMPNLYLFTNFKEESSRLLACLVYFIFFGLIVSSTCSVLWILLPRCLRRRILGKEEGPSSEPASPKKSELQDFGGDARRRHPNGGGSPVVYEPCPTDDTVP